MRRLPALVVAIAVVAGACSGDDDTAVESTTTTTTTTARPSTTSTTAGRLDRETVDLTDACPGIGTLADAAEVTWLVDGRIWSAAPDGSGERCLAEFVGYPELQWGGDADRLIAGERTVLGESGILDVVPDGLEAIGWSRPSGRALLARDDEGALSKLSLDGAPRFDLPLPFTQGPVRYHPAGTAIAMATTTDDTRPIPELFIASNQGEDLRWLVENESAQAITDIEFTADGALLFIAEHDGVAHLHRLVLGSDDLEVVLEDERPLHGLVASPFTEDAVAVTRSGGCGEGAELWARVGGEVLDLSGTPVADGTPVGWLPDGRLVIIVRDSGCDLSPGDLYVVAGTDVRLIAEQVEAAAVRAQLPPPPPPPPEIEAAPA